MQAAPFCCAKCTLRAMQTEGDGHWIRRRKSERAFSSRALLIAAAGALAAVACLQLHTPGAAADWVSGCDESGGITSAPRRTARLFSLFGAGKQTDSPKVHCSLAAWSIPDRDMRVRPPKCRRVSTDGRQPGGSASRLLSLAPWRIRTSAGGGG